LLARELRKASYLAAKQDARGEYSRKNKQFGNNYNKEENGNSRSNYTHDQNSHDHDMVLSPWQVDVICAVPLHWQRHLNRGYNQATLLARRLATLHNLPYQALLSRPKATQQQAKLAADARLANISGAFSATPAVGKRVLLVDDVLTTRATTTECALALLEAGATCVYCVGIVRAHH
jgi:ComF family protein